MKLIKTTSDLLCIRGLSTVLLLYCVVFSAVGVSAQVVPETLSASTSKPDSQRSNTNDKPDADDGFRIEKVPVGGGAELITIFAKHGRSGGSEQGPGAEIPLVSVLRDTLGDDMPENDRLRYVWMLTYTNPTFTQKLSAFVPFLYTRTKNKEQIGTGPPPPVMDVQKSDKALWNRTFWTVFRNLILGEIGIGAKATASQYHQNATDYRQSAIEKALTVMSIYQKVEGESILSDSEMQDIQARLSLKGKTFGWHMQNENLGRVYERDLAKTQEVCSRNWELLRQYSEGQGLYFDPLVMQDGAARHAIIWTSAADIAANQRKKFDPQFLNIKNPWTDDKLKNWKGYTQVRWYDADDRQVAPDTPNARAKTMIPLAVYGLDFPKIPAILVDFRDNGNPKKREISRRILRDLTGSVFSLSSYGGFPFFMGRFLYNYVTRKWGKDINQASRLRSYSQLKLLLTLDGSLDPKFRADIEDRIESATLNPLQNDTDVEIKLARAQYANLMEYAKRPDGLPAKLQEDRREEMIRINHGGKDRAFYAVGHVFSFGLYSHREKDTPEMRAQLDVRRQLDFHERVLREIAFDSAKPEIDSDTTTLKRSLLFISQNGGAAKEKTTQAIARIFAIAGDDDTRLLCLSGLYRINNSSAKKELLSIYENTKIAERWRGLCAHYLKLALKEGQQMSTRDADAIAVIGSN